MRRAQNQIHTFLFRRMDILRTARAQLADTGSRKPRILSFGCSIGDEIVTLRTVFPDAELFGCEIDPVTLDVAQRSAGHLATIFASDRDAVLRHGPFDLICASAVLCLNPPKNIETEFPVSAFDAFLALFDEALVPGGLLAITNASYRFRDSPGFANYDPVRSDVIWSSGFVDVFARDGRPFLRSVPVPSQFLYRRAPAFSISDDEELTESLFRKRPQGEAPAVRTLRLAPPPESFTEAFTFQRSNLDTFRGERNDRLLEVIRRYRFGEDTQTGERGYVLDVAWKSLTGDGMHCRLPIWRIVNDDMDSEQ